MSGSRRLAAGCASLLWLVGGYALPLAHNIDHHADHSHGAVEPQRSATGGHGHHHDPHHVQPRDEGHVESHHTSRSSEDLPEPERVPLDSEHGRNSVLHFVSAVIESGGAPQVEAVRCLSPFQPTSEARICADVRGLPFVRGPPSRRL